MTFCHCPRESPYKYVDHRDAELREYPEVCDQRKCDSHRHRNEAGGKRISKKTAPDNNAQYTSSPHFHLSAVSGSNSYVAALTASQSPDAKTPKTSQKEKGRKTQRAYRVLAQRMKTPETTRNTGRKCHIQEDRHGFSAFSPNLLLRSACTIPFVFVYPKWPVPR